jgi:hypothetical protein
MINKKWLPKRGHYAHFSHRDLMRRKAPIKRFRKPAAVPATTLPVDSLGATPPAFDMDGNDALGDCGPAMCQHVDVIYAWRRGTGALPTNDVPKLEAQYRRVSGGDNGTDEDMLVGAGGIWTAAGGGLEGDPHQVVDDHLDLDFADAAALQYAIDQFFAVCMAWSVPDAFVNGFEPGSTWPSPATPDPENGHYTPLANVDAQGNYTLITWGATCTVSQAFVSSVEPEGFVAFSRQQFDAKGYDAKGRHVADQAAKWVSAGGSETAVAPVVALFPPASPTPPVVPPVVPPVSPPPVPTPVARTLYGTTAPKTISVQVPHGILGTVSVPVPIPALVVTVTDPTPSRRVEGGNEEGPILNFLLNAARHAHLVRELNAAGHPDAQAAVSAGNWSSIIQWITANAPQILALVTELIGLFGA